MFLQSSCKICKKAHSSRNLISFFVKSVVKKVISRATPGRSLVFHNFHSSLLVCRRMVWRIYLVMAMLGKQNEWKAMVMGENARLYLPLLWSVQSNSFPPKIVCMYLADCPCQMQFTETSHRASFINCAKLSCLYASQLRTCQLLLGLPDVIFDSLKLQFRERSGLAWVLSS